MKSSMQLAAFQLVSRTIKQMPMCIHNTSLHTPTQTVMLSLFRLRRAEGCVYGCLRDAFIQSGKFQSNTRSFQRGGRTEECEMRISALLRPVKWKRDEKRKGVMRETKECFEREIGSAWTIRTPRRVRLKLTGEDRARRKRGGRRGQEEGAAVAT